MNVAGVNFVNHLMQVSGERISNLLPAFAEIQKLFFQKMEPGQFKTQGKRGGADWKSQLTKSDFPSARFPQFSAAYAAYKMSALRKRTPFPLMVLSKKLMESLTTGNELTITDKGPKSFAFGTASPYAMKFQTGDEEVPKRELIKPTSEDIKMMMRYVRQYIMTGHPLGSARPRA